MSKRSRHARSRQRLAHELNERKRDIPAILDALHAKAERGDVPAARELRGWYDQGLGRPEGVTLNEGDESKPLDDMTPGEKARVRAQVIARIAELEAQAEPGVVAVDAAADPPAPPIPAN